MRAGHMATLLCNASRYSPDHPAQQVELAAPVNANLLAGAQWFNGTRHFDALLVRNRDRLTCSKTINMAR